MAENISRDQIAKKRIVYDVAGMDAVTVSHHQEIDLYHPNGVSGPAPAVVFVTGFSDAGAQRMVGCRFKEMGAYVSWAQLVAASGMVGVTYANREPADVHGVLDHLQANATTLGIDRTRLAAWSCSGHGPNALSLLMQGAPYAFKCAVLCYPYTLDLDGATGIADAARHVGFVTPCAGKSVDDLRPDLPLFVARAGQDAGPGLNEALDRFVSKALARNLPITVVNHAGPHAFDLFDDSDASRDVIKRILAFLQFHLKH